MIKIPLSRQLAGRECLRIEAEGKEASDVTNFYPAATLQVRGAAKEENIRHKKAVRSHRPI